MTYAIEDLINTYHELNAAVVDQLNEEPSPLEFMRYVSRNRPFIVRQAARDWTAVQKWDADYLKMAMKTEEVRIAMTPKGNADAIVEQHNGFLIFVEPHEVYEPFPDFMDSLRQDHQPGLNVKYAQPQNNSLRIEYPQLYPDVPKDVAFARIALEQQAEAINIWIGDDRSTTSLHKDNYENIYVLVRGQKHFVLLPPVEMPCVNETLLPKGRHAPKSTSTESNDNGDVELGIELDTEAEPVPVAIWDPDLPNERATKYSYLAAPLRVTLREGDMLYLPAMWYHKVSQTAGEEGFVCAINYWYDIDFSGHFWTSNDFVRHVYNAERMKPAYPELRTRDEKDQGG